MSPGAFSHVYSQEGDPQSARTPLAAPAIVIEWYPKISKRTFEELLERFEIVEPDRRENATRIHEAYDQWYEALQIEHARAVLQSPLWHESRRLQEAIDEKRNEIAPHGMWGDLIDRVHQATAPLREEMFAVDKLLAEEMFRLRKAHHHRNLDRFEHWLAEMRDEVLGGDVEEAERMRRFVYRRLNRADDSTKYSTYLRNVDVIDLAEAALEPDGEFGAVFELTADRDDADEIRSQFEAILYRYEIDFHERQVIMVRHHQVERGSRGPIHIGTKEWEELIRRGQRLSMFRMNQMAIDELATWAELNAGTGLRRRWEERYYRAAAPDAVHEFLLDGFKEWLDRQHDVTDDDRRVASLIHDEYVERRHELLGRVIRARTRQVQFLNADQYRQVSRQKRIDSARSMIAIERLHEQTLDNISRGFRSPVLGERFEEYVRRARRSSPHLFQYPDAAFALGESPRERVAPR